MKKILTYILFTQLIFLSCKKAEVEPIFEESANKRVTTITDSYKKQLIDSPFGWKGIYYPQSGNAGGYTFYLKFDAAGKVSMYSDINPNNYDISGQGSYFVNGYDRSLETTYQVKAQQKPSLVFDSYSYLTELVNPDYNSGTGQLADLELAFETVTADKITLVGNVNKTQMTLTKVTQAENDALTKGVFAINTSNATDYANSGRFLSLTFGTGQVSDLSINTNSKVLTAYFLTNNQFGSVSSAFSFTTTGILLKDNITIYGNTFKEMFWDATRKVYYININNRRIDIVESNKLSTPFRLAMGNLFGIVFFDPTLAGQSAVYSQLYTTMKNSLATNSTVAPARILTNVYFAYIEPGVWYLVVEYTRGGSSFQALFGYNVSNNAQGNYTFTYFGTNANSIVITSVKPLTDILERNTFSIDYDPTNGRNAIIKGVTNPSFSMKGSLQ
jgi:Domain of unknown function (DUF4302)